MNDIHDLIGRPLYLAPGEEAEVQLRASAADVQRLRMLWRQGQPLTAGGLGVMTVVGLRFARYTPDVTLRLRGCPAVAPPDDAEGLPALRAELPQAGLGDREPAPAANPERHRRPRLKVTPEPAESTPL